MTTENKLKEHVETKNVTETRSHIGYLWSKVAFYKLSHTSKCVQEVATSKSLMVHTCVV